MAENKVVSITERRDEPKPLHPDSIAALENVLKLAREGQIIAVVMACAWREEGRVCRSNMLENEDGQHVYMLGIASHLQLRASVRCDLQSGAQSAEKP
jgi:hypothetical protein